MKKRTVAMLVTLGVLVALAGVYAWLRLRPAPAEPAYEEGAKKELSKLDAEKLVKIVLSDRPEGTLTLVKTGRRMGGRARLAGEARHLERGRPRLQLHRALRRAHDRGAARRPRAVRPRAAARGRPGVPRRRHGEDDPPRRRDADGQHLLPPGRGRSRRSTRSG